MKTSSLIYHAAVYLSAGSEKYVRVFEDESTAVCGESNALEIMRNDRELSQNQKNALYAYMYLYAKIAEREISKREFVEGVLGIRKGFRKNLDSVMTNERLKYLSDAYYKSEPEKVFTEPADVVIQMVDNVIYMPVTDEKKRLKGLKAEEYEHPLDKKAREILESNSVLKEITKKYADCLIESERIRLAGSCFKATKENLPYVYDVVAEVCRVLDIAKVPVIYIKEIGLNAYTTGTSEMILTLGAACLSLLSHDELMFVIGHELGHMKSKHVRYKQLTRTIPLLTKQAIPIPVVNELAATGVGATLMEWDRKAEYTADRAGLLVCQNPEAAYSVMTKLSGYPMRYYGELDSKYILEQARSFEDMDSKMYSKTVKTMLYLGSSHPWTVMRAKMLDEWVKKGEYDKIMKRAVEPRENTGRPQLINITVKDN